MKGDICIVTFPLSEAGYTPLSNSVKLLSQLSENLYIISGGAALKKLENSNLESNVHTMTVVHRVSSNILRRIFNYINTQIRILRYVIIISRHATFFIFSIGGEDLVIPVLLLRLMRKTVALMPGGIATKGYLIKKDPLSKFLSLLTFFNFLLANRLIIYSSSLIKEANLTSYYRKTVIAYEHFVDFRIFLPKKKIDERLNVIGYIGRLSEEKGVQNLITAIPLVLAQRPDMHFLICGEGNLSCDVGRMIKNYSLDSNVKTIKWIPHENVPQYLNELKLLVLPSFTEGLPNILLESMACGTPVIAASVGSIPDIISDGKNGFLLESNSPKLIAAKIIELISKPELLKQVSETAIKWVQENFNQERTKKVWKDILKEI